MAGARLQMTGRWDGQKRLRALTKKDVGWLRALSHGLMLKELGKGGGGYPKNRLKAIRGFMKVRTTNQAVAEAIRRGIIA